MENDTKGLGLSYLAFAKAVAAQSPRTFQKAIGAVYAELDKESQQNSEMDLRLGFEFTELAETFDKRSTKPSVLLKRLRQYIATEGKS